MWAPEVGIFVAVSRTSTSTLDPRIMTSSDGIHWISRPVSEITGWSRPELGHFSALATDSHRHCLLVESNSPCPLFSVIFFIREY